MTPIEADLIRFRPADDVEEWPPGVLLASPAWFEALAQIVMEEVALAPAHLAGASLSFQEVFTNVPPDGGAVAWRLRIDGGSVTELVYGEPVAGAELEQVVSWPESLTMCRMRKTDPRYPELRRSLGETGAVSVSGTSEGWAVFREMFDRLHDRVVLRTQ